MSQLRNLAEDLGVDERTLRRAAGQGTLRAERLSPRKLKIAPGEAGYLRRRWPMLAALRAFALLFGSAARGDDGADSDLDLIVALRDPSLDGMVELQDRLERRLGREVDVLSVEAASSNDLLISTAVGEGRVLVDRIDLWPGLRSELGALRQRADRGSKRDRQRTLAEIDRFLS